MPISVLPPAVHGTIKVTGRAGKFCPCAPPSHVAKPNPAASTPITVRFIAFPSRHPRIPRSAGCDIARYVRSHFAAIAGLCPRSDSPIAALMTATPDTTPASARFADTLALYIKPHVQIVPFLGSSAGLPLALSGSTLLVWMREAGVDLGTIGLFALVGTPYTVKFLWAPIVDALDVPLLSSLLGRRRGWLIFSQLLLIAAIVFLAFC